MPDLWSHYKGQDEARKSAAQEQYLSEIQECRSTLRRDPHHADTYLRLAECYKELGQDREALSVLKEGVDRCPPTPQLYRRYITRLNKCNQVAEAIEVAEQGLLALAGTPDAGAMRRWKHLLLPVLYDAPEEIDRHRQRFERELAAFCQETTLDTAAERASALEAVNSATNFYLAFQGRNDRNLQHQYGRFLQRVMAANYPQWAAPVELPPLGPSEKLRVGYASSHFYHHSVMKTHSGWILEHDKSKIDVYTYHAGKPVDATTQEIERNSIRFCHTPADLEGACEAITRDRLHVLVFLDIGMQPIMGLMGALRLAPVQCGALAHPVTSGLDTIDYSISSSLMEPDHAAEHYTERLVCLPGVGLCYRKPVIPRAILLKSRGDFGLRDDAVVYASCHPTRTHLPEHDYLFGEIAARVPNAQFVFLAPNELVAEQFRRRLDGMFSKIGLSAGRHCVMLPMMGQLDYWNLLLVCDVYLDTMEWSGCNTTFEAIACDLPIVTMPGSFMRGRHAYAILTQLGVTGTIARDEAEYVELAVRLGVDLEWRKSVAARMKEGSPKLYGDKTCVRALEAFYEKAVEERLVVLQ